MEEEVNHDEVDDLIAELIEQGLIIEHLHPETGEKLYSISNKAQDHAPDLWEAHIDDMKQSLYRLFMAGAVTIMFSDEGPMMDTVALTDLAFDEKTVETLDYFDQQYLKHLINVFDSKI